MVRSPKLAISALIVYSGQSLHVRIQEADSCFVLSQSLHDLKYEHASTLQKIDGVHSRVRSLTESDASDQAKLSERITSLRQNRENIADLALEIKSAEASLKDRKLNADKLSGEINQTLSKLHQAEHQASETREVLQSLLTRHEEIEARIRQNELRSQMLVNDIDAANHTARDAWNSFADLVVKESASMTDAKMLLTQVRSAKQLWDGSSVKLSELSSDLDKLKKTATRIQNTIFTRSQEQAEQQRKLDSASRQAENDRLEAMRMLNGLYKFRNESLLKSEQRMEAIQREIAGLQLELNLTKADLGNHTLPRIHPQEAIVGLDLNISSLRAEIQDSRRLVSRAGYGGRFSLLQEKPEKSATKAAGSSAAVDEELQYYRDTSKIVSLEEQVKQLEAEGVNADRSFKSGLESAKQSIHELRTLFDRTVVEDGEVQVWRTALRNTTTAIRSIKREMEDVRREIQEKQNLLESTQKLTQDNRSKYEDLLTSFVNANTSLADLVSAAKRSESEYRKKVEEIRKLRREQVKTRKSAGADARELTLADASVVEKRHLLSNLTETTKNLGEHLEDTRRKHTELIAEISQITRRLEDKLGSYEQEVTTSKKLDSEVTDLEADVQRNLGERKRQDGDLDELTKLKFELEDKIQETTHQLTSLRCNV